MINKHDISGELRLSRRTEKDFWRDVDIFIDKGWSLLIDPDASVSHLLDFVHQLDCIGVLCYKWKYNYTLTEGSRNEAKRRYCKIPDLYRILRDKINRLEQQPSSLPEVRTTWETSDPEFKEILEKQGTKVEFFPDDRDEMARKADRDLLIKTAERDRADTPLPEVREIWELADPEFAKVLMEMGANVRLISE